jgi:hypothetical protein
MSDNNDWFSEVTISELLAPKLESISRDNVVCYKIIDRGHAIVTKVQIHLSYHGEDQNNYAKIRIGGREVRLNLPDWPPPDCIVPCYGDGSKGDECEFGFIHCADIHAVNKSHEGLPCPGIHICGEGEGDYLCCASDS